MNLLSLSIIFFLCCFWSFQAIAIERPKSMYNVFERHFFSVNYVNSMWNIRNRERILGVIEKNSYMLEKSGANREIYEEWKSLDKTNPIAGEKFLDTVTEPQKIKNTYDMELLYEHWWKIYNNWRNSKKFLEYEDFSDFAKVGYNQCDAGHAFAMCGPLPDWRNKANRKNEMKKRINRMANKVYWIKSGCKIAEDIKKKSECAPVRKYHALLKKACLPIMKPAFPFSTVGPEAEVCVD